MTPPGEGDAAAPEITLITSAQGADFRAIAALNVLAWGRPPRRGELEQRAIRLAEEVAALAPAGKGIFLAGGSAAPVGFCRVIRDAAEADHWWLAGIVVHPDHRRQGIGRRLALEGIGYARARGARVIRSETHVDNEASIRFHASLGFASEGEFTAADGDRKIGFRLEREGTLPYFPCDGDAASSKLV